MAESKIIKINPGESVTIVCEEVQPTPTPEPTPTPTPDNGEPMYKVGKISDAHFDIEDSHNSEYLEDLKNALRYYEQQGVTHIDCNGDLCQYKDKDLIAFREAYDSKLPFFTVMGNHDYLRIYEQKDASHQVPAGYKDFEDLWYQTVQSLADGAEIHYFGKTFKDHLNFFFERKGDLHVFISVDYGKSLERYDVIRAINRLDYDDPNVKLMTDYVNDTQYDRKRETNFDYRFYNPAALVWLKNILEANQKKRTILNMHHFLPNGSGDTDNQYRHLRIWPVPTPELVDEKFYSGSNTLCGLEFYFIDKLLRNHLNVICFGGHTHRETKAQEDVITRAYYVTQPTGNEVTPLVDDLNSLNGTKYDYQIYRADGHSYADTAPTVHLPSLAKPTGVDGSTKYGASEGVLMKVFEDRVVIDYIRFKTEGSDKYTNETIKTVTLDIANDQSPLVEPEQPEQGTEPTFKGIKIVFCNKTGQDIRFAGKFLPYNQEETEAMPFYLCPPNEVGDYCHWSDNPYSLKNGESMTFEFTELKSYTANKGKLVTKKIPLSTVYGKHFRTADTAVWPSGIAAIKFGVCAYDRSKKDTSTGPAMIHAIPIPESNCLIKEGGVYEVILDKIKDNATLDKSYIDKPYKDGDKYKYVII
jgi:predicted phosphodiesterase